MKGVLGIALQSMQHDMKRVERVSVNMANALTPGYKREVVIEHPFSSMIADGMQHPDANNVRLTPAMNLSDPSAIGLDFVTDHQSGTLKPTGEKLDFALASEGFFQVATPNGMAYTRQGSFRLDARGRLVTAQGYAVMGKGGEIQLHSNAPRVDAEGKVFDSTQTNAAIGAPANAVAQLNIVRFEHPGLLQKNADGLWIASEDAGMLEVKNPQVMQAQLENSNVSSMQEMVTLMQTMRHLESMAKVAQGYDEMLGTAIRKLGDLS